MSPTPQQVAEKWKRRAQAAVPDYQAGIEAVTTSPTAKAADKIDKMRANFLAALDSGYLETQLRAVGLEEWKRKTVLKGVRNMAAGIEAGTDKMQAFMTEFLPFLDTIKTELDRMPDATLEDSINRMVHQIRRAAEFRTRGGR